MTHPNSIKLAEEMALGPLPGERTSPDES